MKRYRVELERKVYKDKMCIELNASNISEAMHKARDFMEKHIIITVQDICHII